MPRLGKFVPTLLAILVLSVAAGPTYAGVVQLTAPAQLNPGDFTSIYPQAPGTNLLSPYVQVDPGNTLTFTETGSFRVLVQGGGVVGTSWFGNFPNGMKVLYTGNAFTGQGSGPVTITFSNPVTELGLLFQNNNLGSTTNSFSVFNGALLLGTFSGTQQGSNVLFLGAAATGGDLITRIVITGLNNDFAIGPVTYGNTTVPEPVTLFLFGTGMAGMGLARRFKTRKLRQD